MKIVEQLALFLDNEPGTLAAVCDALADAQINIYALSIADSVDYAVIRLVVSDPRRALHLFEERGTLVVEDDVLMLEGSNKPGGLSAISKVLAKKKINIEYAYLATLPTAKKGLLILRVTDVKKAQKVLEDAGFGI
ncbi:MAG: ACT domain-containing protein [Chthoniobacterales bacterium]